MKKPFFDFAFDTIKQLRTVLFLQEYAVSLKEETEDNYTENGTRLQAEVSIDPVYLTAIIHIYPVLADKYHSGKKSEVIEVLLHEMCHLLTEPLYLQVINGQQGKLIPSQQVEEVRERQTQRICNVIFKILNTKK